MTKGKKMKGVIGKLLRTGQRSGCSMESAGSRPRSHLVVSPRGVVTKCDMGGVGLGIVAALSDDFTEPDISDEEYTKVTRHMPSNNSYTKVYAGKGNNKKIFDICPVDVKGGGEFLLSSCDECRKGLQGRDVYMYRGERPYCSVECRDRAMWKEERTCTLAAASTSDIFSTSIFAI